tara:strand:+ start:214 stop:432 length:219 start_codon:yes stop_codon:yes gene_type:complete
MSENTTPPVKTKVADKRAPVAPKKKKKKKSSYKNLMKSIMKSNFTDEERAQKQRERLNNALVDVNFKKVDVI